MHLQRSDSAHEFIFSIDYAGAFYIVRHFYIANHVLQPLDPGGNIDIVVESVIHIC